jgi:hypothetical protein
VQYNTKVGHTASATVLIQLESSTYCQSTSTPVQYCSVVLTVGQAALIALAAFTATNPLPSHPVAARSAYRSTPSAPAPSVPIDIIHWSISPRSATQSTPPIYATVPTSSHPTNNLPPIDASIYAPAPTHSRLTNLPQSQSTRQGSMPSIWNSPHAPPTPPLYPTNTASLSHQHRLSIPPTTPLKAKVPLQSTPQCQRPPSGSGAVPVHRQHHLPIQPTTDLQAMPRYTPQLQRPPSPSTAQSVARLLICGPRTPRPQSQVAQPSHETHAPRKEAVHADVGCSSAV